MPPEKDETLPAASAGAAPEPAHDPVQSPRLTDDQWARLLEFGEPEEIEPGDYLFRTGQRDYNLMLIESGQVEIVREPLGWVGEVVITTIGPRSFLGELGILNGQAAFLSARVTEPGIAYRVSEENLRRLMAEDDELCDILLHALWARREALRSGPAALTLKLVGSKASSEFLALRRFAERTDLVHTAIDLEDVVDKTHHADYLEERGFTKADLPIAYVQGEPILRATPGLVADRLGLSYQASTDDFVDLTVIGGGPAGLAAAIYGASEGLRTVLLDAAACPPGATSRIENFLGFPFGVTGRALIGQASLQALKFGVRVYAPCEAVSLTTIDEGLEVTLRDGRTIHTRSAIVTSGAAYRTLDLDRWNDFEGSGIFYAATPLELRQVMESPVVVVGGANSAGQAALYLASNGCPVRLVVRGDDLSRRMSSYLVTRLLEDPRVEVLTRSHVVGLDGDRYLRRVHIDRVGEVEARGLFCFIGAEPATSWLNGVDRDPEGFLRTGVDIPLDALGEDWRRLGREPLPFETSLPRVFAAGDVRRGSMKRVAAAVGEGSSAVASVHRALASVGGVS
jgi:thioredoxin reductase (NADPH)